MITLRKEEERGHFDHGWLDTHHTFSFGDYHDPEQMGFRSLRVLNDDRVAPGAGFGEHGHKDMEIITYVLEGELAHKDSLNNGSVLRAGDVQVMSAGTGVRHSEFNNSQNERLHFYQIWIQPEEEGLEPGYEERRFPDQEKTNRLLLIASQQGRGNSLKIHQDVDLYSGVFEPGAKVVHEIRPGRSIWVQTLRGAIEVNGEGLQVGDGAAITGETKVTLNALSETEVLVFDLT